MSSVSRFPVVQQGNIKHAEMLCNKHWNFCFVFAFAITSLGEERANLSVFRTFDRFALVWFCLFPLPLGVWEGLRFVSVALPGLFSYLFFLFIINVYFIPVLRPFVVD